MELDQRLAYMEKLLSHYTGHVNLDADTLRNLAESIEHGNRPQPLDEQSQGSGYLGVEDEVFTVKPLDNNIARMVFLNDRILRTNLAADHIEQITLASSRTGTSRCASSNGSSNACLTMARMYVRHVRRDPIEIF
jgi:hypothetical protein